MIFCDRQTCLRLFCRKIRRALKTNHAFWCFFPKVYATERLIYDKSENSCCHLSQMSLFALRPQPLSTPVLFVAVSQQPQLENLITSEVHSRITGWQGTELLNTIAQQRGSKGIIAKLKKLSSLENWGSHPF